VAKKVRWLDRPEPDNWRSANTYLGLLGYGQSPLPGLPGLPVETLMAKDILRASGLQRLHQSNEKVESKVDKVNDGTPLSPLILLRGIPGVRPLIIADGYHRISALYVVDKEIEVRVVIVDLEIPTKGAT
jgi:hypothetical protein